jgi:hypothetical protein
MSSRWPGSLINKTAPTPSGGGAQDSASGVWTLDQANPYIASQTWPGTGVPDPQFQYVTALLHGDGTNGAQNNTFLDSSSNNFTITRNGNTTQGSFSPYGSLWSNYFDGSSYLTPSSYSLSISTSADFTLEAWVFVTTTPSGFSTPILSSSTSGAVYFGNTSSGFGLRNIAGSNLIFASFTTINQWVHVAVTRTSGTLRLFFNGVLQSTVTGNTTAFTSGVPIIGNDPGQSFFPGYISNLRIVNGTAVYTSNFTPSTTPLTAISGTSLLTCQSNRFIDNSSNNFTITPSGSPSVQRFSPFQNLATYQTAKIGGSQYSSAGGDQLTIPNNTAFAIGGGDFTISFWMYPQDISVSEAWIVAQTNYSSNTGWSIFQNAGTLKLRIGNTGGTYQSSSSLTALSWQYIQIVRSSGTLTMYRNGVSIYSGSVGNWTDSTAYPFLIGGITTTTGWNNNVPFVGYLTDVQVIKGTALSVQPIPTLPATNINSASVLTNFTNGAIYDNAEMNDLQTVGSAQISTSVVKYGTGSMYFPTSGTNYLASQINPTVPLGSGNFTVEGWFYFTAVGANYEMISKETAGAAQDGFRVVLNSSNHVVVNMSSNGTTYALTITGAATIVANTWYHVAISKVGTTVTSYINGNADGSATFSGSLYETNTFWALATRGGYGTTMQGYIDDFRVTAGYARYWFNFQPPSAPYPNYGGVVALLPYDPLFNQTTLLLNGDGTNGAQNNTFLDSSTNNFTITRNGNTTQGSFSPYGSNWGVYYNGNQNFIAPTQTAIGTNDFTLEGWVNISSFTNRGSLIALGTNSSQNGPSIRINTDGSVNATIENSSGITGSYVTSASNLVVGTWYHIAYVRASGTLKLYINGVASGTPVTNTTNCDSTKGCVGGQYPDYSASGRAITGYISNARVVRNQALFSGTFTPSTLPLTTGTVGATGAGAASSITGTVSFLVCNANNFATSWTFDGTPSVQRFSPFNPTASYSTSLIGGSGYFNGSTDWLTASPTNLGSGDFTVEAWVYLTNPTAYQDIIGTNTTGNFMWALNHDGNTNYISIGRHNIAFDSDFFPAPLKAYSWNHIAISRSSGVAKCFVNGLQVGSNSSNSQNYVNSNMLIGAHANSFEINGNMTDLRMVVGTSVYNSNFTPPSAPLTAITNTSLLTNMTNAGIPDLAMQNDLQTVGSAQVSTSVKKYGTGSLSFNGTNSALLTPSSPLVSAWTGDFTIECWVYANLSQYFNIWCNSTSNSDGFTGALIYTDGTVTMGRFGVNEFTTSSGAVTSNTWTHLAFVGFGGTAYIYVNGVQRASASQSTYVTTTTKPITLGRNYQTSPNYALGYIDDFRVTYGLARYTATFTPPTSALPTY